MVAGWGSGFLASWGYLRVVTVPVANVLVVTALAVTSFVACPGAGC